ncbi:DNA cytosine methyltransferase [Methanocella arvoryzae]|uniref:DNA (cytosine-5-)-methyltransferase n=1 Tax=Methanocella arvoryzae (strain DSM 22066 / NBRC 105507 / MRE50) TaxID=351160 RepID=Q0W1Z9_METAR|nr:DNA cytosine methyltransferase [Methanocella arvoryzae]CAJ37594.1 C-5 cytosine-specific DNA methyltransferase [Methanocella arvoryzae MRE50]
MSFPYTVLDLFSGAGGLTEGFYRNGFDIISHIEKDEFASKTLQTRSLYYALLKINKVHIYYNYYNNRINRDEFLKQCCELGIDNSEVIHEEISLITEDSLIDKINTQLIKRNINKINVVIGGPPCQAYSLIGRGRDRYGMLYDPRNHLYKHYIRFIQTFSPDLFVFENVPGIRSAKNGMIIEDFKKMIDESGYDSDQKILNASNFNVLQNRKRIIIIGWKKEYNLSYPDFAKSQTPYIINDLLSDLPELKPGCGSEISNYTGDRTKYLQESGIRTDETCIRHHVARPHNDRDREIYRIAIEKWNNGKKRIKYTELDPSLKTHKNEKSFLDRFKVVNGNGLSHSIVAHLSKDGHYFIHPDISQCRSLTVREAARIQSFPDNYLFEGPRSSQFIQIGNAVPPLMASGIATKIKDMLNRIYL